MLIKMMLNVTVTGCENPIFKQEGNMFNLFVNAWLVIYSVMKMCHETADVMSRTSRDRQVFSLWYI
jgi:hypothetical protein